MSFAGNQAEKPSQAADFWQNQAGAFVNIAANDNSFYSLRAKLTGDLIAKYCEPCRCLDVGCGLGLLSYELAIRGFDIHGTDISRHMLELTASRIKGLVGECDSRLRLTQGDTPPFPWRFKLITALGVFPYVADYETYVDYLSEQLETRGLLVTSSINRLSLATLKFLVEHLFRLQWNREWCAVGINLIRTGLWSGGFVNYAHSRQKFRASPFERLVSRGGFEFLEAFDLYNLDPAFDAKTLDRSAFGKDLARHLGWCHVAIFRKL